MESTCPATPPATDTQSPKPPDTSNGAASPKVERDSPEPNCAICLGKTENKSFTDSCLHQFCFNCLLEWSKVKAECPLCKQSFKSIIHNVRSNEDYDQYHLRPAEPNFWPNVEQSVVRFRYRTTLTADRQRERYLENIVPPYYLGTDVIPAQRANPRRRHRVHTSEFRTQIYRENLWVNPLPDVTGRYRECSPDFYRMNPAQMHRLVPWLNRELNVLRVNSTHLVVVMDLILNLLTRFSINSLEFRGRLAPYIGIHTGHFLHEFYAFARSPYDMVGFDNSAEYQPHHPNNYSFEVQPIASDSDSDVILLSPEPSTSHGAETNRNTDTHPSQPLNLSANSSTAQGRLSPVPGPSGLGSADDFMVMITNELQNPTYRDTDIRVHVSDLPSTSRSVRAQTVDSDSEDCLIVGYVKPRHERTPEIITLESEPETSHERVSVEDLSELLFSTSSSSSSDTSDSDFVPFSSSRKATSKFTKAKKAPAYSEDSDVPIARRRQHRRELSSDSDLPLQEVQRRRRKSKLKPKHKKIPPPPPPPPSPFPSSDDECSESHDRTEKNRKSREVWRIVRKQESETDHDYSMDCYNPPYTEDEVHSFASTSRPKLRSIVITKSGGNSKQRDHSYSSVASSSRSSSHFRETRYHKHKSRKVDKSKKKKERRRSSSSTVRTSKGRKKPRRIRSSSESTS